MEIKMSTRQLSAILITLLLSINSLFAQTVDSVYEDGKLYVKINDASSIVFNDYNGNPSDLNADILSLQSIYGITKISRPFIVYGGIAGQKTYQFEFTNINAISGLISDLTELNYIEYAERIPILKLSLITNDPDFNAGSLSATNWHLKKINAETAWNINTGSAAVIIAVIDNEIQQNHPELMPKLWTNPLDPIDGVDNDLNGIVDDFNGADYADMDGNTNPNILLNHGTHCAGIAVGATNNAFGISSIGYNCRLMPLKATSDASPFPTSISMTAAINCIDYARTHGANVISMSFASFGFSATLATATNAAIASGITVVAAAGNNGGMLTLYPAGNPGVIGVAATDYTDLKASFSNFGPAVDVCAPGVNIYSTNSTLQPTTSFGYDFKSGTSMATPLVAGLCGLMLTQNPALTPAQVQNCLTTTATNIDAINPGFAGNLGAGRINAPQAILCAGNAFNAFFTTDISTSCPNNTFNLTGFSNAAGILSWNWTFAPAPTTIIGNTTPNVAVTFASPGPVTVTLTVVTGSGSFVYTQTAYLNVTEPSATFVSPAAGSICDGSAQQLVINFQNCTPPINYTVTNGYTTENFTTNNLSTSYFFRADINHPTYTVAINANATNCASGVNPQINLNIINCCQNLIVNGDFELGNTSFSSDNFITCTTPAGTISQGLASAYDGSPGVLPNTIACTTYGFGAAANHRNAIFGLDTRCGANEAGTMLIQAPLPFNTPAFQAGFTSRLWFQTNVPLVAGDVYNVDYFTASSGGGGGYPFLLRFEVLDAGGLPIFTSGDYVTQSDYNWHQFSFIWNNVYTGLATVRLVQVDYFANTFFDISVDDISIRRTNIPPTWGAAYAGADINLCNGSNVQLSGSGEPAYLWGPAASLSATNIAQPIASPAVTTTYTLTVTNGCGVTTDEVNVIVIPSPVVNATVSAPVICEGSSTNLNATGAVSYSWLPTTGLSSPTIPNPVATPLVTTTYTVTGTAANGCTATATVTINVNPIPTGNPVSNISTCTGTTVSASSFSSTPTGATYTWTNSNTAIGLGASGAGNVPSFTATNPGTTAIVATITVTPTLGGCTGTTFNYTITVNPLPVVTFGAITPNACSSGPPLTLTTGSPAGGVYSGPNVSGSVFIPPVVTISTSYTLTYTYTDPITGCANSATQSITVDVCAGPCGTCPQTLDALAPGGNLSTNPPGFQNYCLLNNITITAPVTITLSEVSIAPGVTITVNPGASLTLTGSHLYACSDMWKGIVVKPGGTVKTQNFSIPFPSISKSTMIEDAFIAINVLPGSTVTSNLLSITNTTFNRNQVGIKIDSYSPALATYPFTIVSSVFTSRSIAFTPGAFNWPHTNAIKATYAVSNPLQTPYINDVTYPDGTAGAYLKPPFSPMVAKPTAHISINRVGQTINPATVPTYYEMKIGSAGVPNYNVFDNMAIGIDATNSNFTSVNNVFQRTISLQKNTAAINAVANEIFNCRLQAIPAAATNFFNKFYDCNISIQATNYFEVNARYCDVRSLQNFGSQYSLPHRGQNGIVLNTNRYVAINLVNNTFSNIEFAISFATNNSFYSVGPWSSGSGQYSGQVDINQNTFQPFIPGFPLLNTYLDRAIVANNVTGTTHFISPSQSVNTNDNQLNNVFRGIRCNNWQKKTVNSNNNNISLLDLPVVSVSQYGITHANNIAVAPYVNSIKSNIVTGYGIIDPAVAGIATFVCSNQLVQCNTTRNITVGIYFSGYQIPTVFDHNTFDNSSTNRHLYAYVLDNSGFIGQQGTSSSPSDNRWLGTWAPFVNFKTATMNGSIAWNGLIGSPLWVRSGAIYNPGAGFNTNILAPIDYNSPAALNIATPSSPFIICPPVFHSPILPPGLIQTMEKIAKDEIAYTINNEPTKIIGKNQLYRMLKNDPSYMASSVDLQDFYLQSQLTYREQFSAIEEDIVVNDFASAQSKISGLALESGIEINYKDFYNLYIKQQTDSLISDDSTHLYIIASGCPHIDGAIVYQARAMYNSIYDVNKDFEDNCVNVENRSAIAAYEIKHSFDADLFPNPSTGEIFVNPKGFTDETMQISVKDVSGKIVYSDNLLLANGITNFRLDISNGVYFVHITNIKTHETIVKKLVIQK